MNALTWMSAQEAVSPGPPHESSRQSPGRPLALSAGQPGRR